MKSSDQASVMFRWDILKVLYLYVRNHEIKISTCYLHIQYYKSLWRIHRLKLIYLQMEINVLVWAYSIKIWSNLCLLILSVYILDTQKIYFWTEFTEIAFKSSWFCRFIKNPEFVKVGAKVLFREGRTKGLGKVTQVFPFEYSREEDR